MNQQVNANSKHFKMYKSGRKWMVASLTAVTLLTATGVVAHADENNANDQPAAVSNVNTDSQAANQQSTAVNNVAPASASTAASQAATANTSATNQDNSAQATSTQSFAAQTNTQ